MGSFLGVPILSRGAIIGAFYLTDKQGAQEFSDDDRRLIEMLAAHAAIAIENARLYERSRELSVVEERNRLARELHDAVSQKLFGLVLTADAAGTLVESDPEAARVQLERLRELAREAIAELRSIIFELRPPELDTEGLAETLRKHVEVLRRVYEPEIALDAGSEPRLDAAAAGEVLRIAQEALQNALRHAAASRIDVRLSSDGAGVVLEVTDDGAGFDPAAPDVRSHRLGLTSMEERARALGGTLAISSEHGAGTTVRLELPA
jgi:signal transduction histidine kinase